PATTGYRALVESMSANRPAATVARGEEPQITGMHPARSSASDLAGFTNDSADSRHASASLSSRLAVSTRSASVTLTMFRARPASSTGTVSAHRLARAGARRGTGTNGARARSATDDSGESGAPTATNRAPRRAAASA